MPFGPSSLVMKAAGKVFAIAPLDEADFRLNLKCDPQRAVELREQYAEVIVPGWHMNKKHWNTVYAETGELEETFIREMIDDSYTLVVASLTKKIREQHAL